MSRVRTAPCYRMYALAGGPPHRPGLVRGEDGAALEVELWDPPLAAFGRFVQEGPSPLAMGELVLEDGRTVKGFVCEPHVLADARDITGFGGWRNYLAMG